jgi:hypothetical protein
MAGRDARRSKLRVMPEEKSAEQKLAVTSGVLFFVAGFNMLLGFLGALGISFLKEMGIGSGNIALGLIYLVLAFFAKQQSIVALGIAIALFAIDGIASMVIMTKRGGTLPVGGLIFRAFLLWPMIQGFRAIRDLQQSTIPEFKSPAASPQLSSQASPSSPPAQSAGAPAPFSFVAPSSGQASQKPLEMSAPSFVVPDPAVSSSMINQAEIRTKPVTSEFVAAALRFLAYRCEIGDTGVRAIYSSGKQQEFQWTDFSAVVVRLLPSIAPFEGKLLLDLVYSPVAGKPPVPLRMFSTTFVNYAFLPQGASPSSHENIRRLARFVVAKNRDIVIDPGTNQFIYMQKVPPRFANIAQFAEYESRYS